MLIRSMLLLSISVSNAGAQKLAITEGVVDDQVFQRDETGLAAIVLAGSAANLNSKAIEIRVSGKHGALPGLDWTASGKVVMNKWTAKVDVPTGGPYQIEVRSGAVAAASVHNVLVGDLWVLAGQSNMEGVGNLTNVQPPNGLVHSFNQADNWVLAEEPLHSLADAADRVHWRKNSAGQLERYEGQRLMEWVAARKKGAGLGLPFANEMVRRTQVPIGLVPCAHGGTSMDQWSPLLLGQAGDSLYGATIRRIRLLGGKVRGVLWYQGESDASPKAAPAFQKKFQDLVAAFRKDLEQPDLPFYYVQIGRHISSSNQESWNEVQDAQRRAETQLARSGMAPAVDLALDDGIHVGTQELKRLARRMSNLACKDLFPKVEECATVKQGPRPVNAKLGGSTIRVTFATVNGRMRSPGRISGFSIHDAGGTAVPLIYRAEFDGSSSVVLYVGNKLPEGATLRYGAGKDPYCNIVDQRDMALPVFGPLPIEQ
ncbi:MAG: sialate O-acetylesterase [Acidobacteria bacterium]|nr:sialate O-acetylesterase [Acidobacteriota bacterium]